MKQSIVALETELKKILVYGFVLKAIDTGFLIYVPGGPEEWAFEGPTILACIRKYNISRKGRPK